jgi:two-component system, NtrC family, sensor kinase
LLNLFNHAFYAVTDRLKQSGFNYEPAISVSTKREKDIVFIVITDIGTGLPKALTGKNFQAILAPDATREETGLGLSLSYDIVRAHGGEIRVESKENEFSRFIIEIPA